MKTSEERGPLSAWVFESREKLDPLTVEQVAAEIRIHPSQIRKLEAGGPTYVASRRLQREVPALLMRVAKERGVELEPLPPAEIPDQPTDLVEAIREQTRVMADLVEEMRLARQGIPEWAVAIVSAQHAAEAGLTPSGREERDAPRPGR